MAKQQLALIIKGAAWVFLMTLSGLACADVRPFCQSLYATDQGASSPPAKPDGNYRPFDWTGCHGTAAGKGRRPGDVGFYDDLCLTLAPGSKSWVEDIPEYCAGVCPASMSVKECMNLKKKGKSQCPKGNPCDPMTGNKFQTEQDYRSVDGYLDVVRYYNSLEPKNIGWGFGWTSSLSKRLVIDNSTSTPYVTIYRADGKGEAWQYKNSVWSGEKDTIYQLQKNSTGYTLIHEGIHTEQYDLQGKLTSITNNHGTTLYNYDTSNRLKEVIDPFQRKLTITYNSNNLVDTITTPDGVINYLYDANLNLQKVTYPDTKTRQYLYGETSQVSNQPAVGVSYKYALTGLVDENNVRYASWTYDANGKVASSEHAGAVDKYVLTHSYDSTVIVTNPLQSQQTLDYGYKMGAAKVNKVSSSDMTTSLDNSYDVAGNITKKIDYNLNVSCYAYNSRNLETYRIEGMAPGSSCPSSLASYIPDSSKVERKIATEWHATYRFPTKIVEPLRQTVYSYFDNGTLKSVAVTALDQTGGVIANATRTTNYTYSTKGKIQTIDGPRPDTDVIDKTTYAYDTLTGNLSSITNALSHVTGFGNYDGSGRARTITDPNGLITTLVYDPRGRLTSSTTGTEVTIYQYKVTGDLEMVTLPSGARYTYGYDDAHRLTDITDRDGNNIHYTLDPMGNRTKEEVKNSTGTVVKTHSRQFDKLSRLWKDVGMVNGDTTVYGYDNNGNVTKITDPLNRVTDNKYDALNRLISTTEPKLSTETTAGVTQYNYDLLDQLTKITDPRNLSTSYTINGLGNRTAIVSPDTGTASATFDEAGNVKTSTDAKGQIATYTYDALNRVTKLTYSRTASPTTYEQIITYEYDQGVNAKGRLSKISEQFSTTNYSYNSMGRISSIVRQLYPDPANKTVYASYTTGYGYDTSGRMNKITYPSGRTIDYLFDTSGRINKISTTYNGTTSVLASNISYFPFGGVSGFTHGDTTSTQKYTRTIDSDGRLGSYTLKGSQFTLGYDVASQLTSITSAATPTQPAVYTYDALGHVGSYSQNTTQYSYIYDTVGNRTRKVAGSTTTQYTYPTSSNRLNTVQVGSNAAQTMVHDAIGEMTSDPTRSNSYAYDIRGRMNSATSAAGTSNYSIDAQGLRVRKKTSTADTWYHYDLSGQLIAENIVGSSSYIEYVYLGDLPIALMQP